MTMVAQRLAPPPPPPPPALLLPLRSNARLASASRPRPRPRPSTPLLFIPSPRPYPFQAILNRSLAEAESETEGTGDSRNEEDEELEGEEILSSSSSDPTLHIKRTCRNGRRISASIPISAPLEALWRALTDYERLAEFIPGLSVCKVQERWSNGARLYQIGEQNLALGLKFKAKGVIVVTEMPSEAIPCGIRRNIDFEMIEGDFKIFKGTWQMEEATSAITDSDTTKTVLTYVVDVQPHAWLPVRLVEGILGSEICNNLICVRNEVLSLELSSRLSEGDPTS